MMPSSLALCWWSQHWWWPATATRSQPCTTKPFFFFFPPSFRTKVCVRRKRRLWEDGWVGRQINIEKLRVIRSLTPSPRQGRRHSFIKFPAQPGKGRAIFYGKIINSLVISLEWLTPKNKWLKILNFYFILFFW